MTSATTWPGDPWQRTWTSAAGPRSLCPGRARPGPAAPRTRGSGTWPTRGRGRPRSARRAASGRPRGRGRPIRVLAAAGGPRGGRRRPGPAAPPGRAPSSSRPQLASIATARPRPGSMRTAEENPPVPPSWTRMPSSPHLPGQGLLPAVRERDLGCLRRGDRGAERRAAAGAGMPARTWPGRRSSPRRRRAPSGWSQCGTSPPSAWPGSGVPPPLLPMPEQVMARGSSSRSVISSW